MLNDEWLKLESAGKTLFGSSWQKDLTEALGLNNSSHLRGWKQRGVPSKVWDDIRIIAKNRVNEITEILL